MRVPSEAGTSKFLDAVFKQTDIVPHHQEYFFEGHPYELDPNLQAHNFCRTARHNPLTLLSCAEQPEDVVGVRYRDPALDFPKFVPKVDVVADCSAAKVGRGRGDVGTPSRGDTTAVPIPLLCRARWAPCTRRCGSRRSCGSARS